MYHCTHFRMQIDVMGGDFVALTEDLWEDLDEFRRYSASLDCSVS